MLRKKRKLEHTEQSKRDKKKQNHSTARLSAEINKIHFLAIKLYSEQTEYSIASIIETAIEQFFPNIDFENLSEIDNDD